VARIARAPGPRGAGPLNAPSLPEAVVLDTSVLLRVIHDHGDDLQPAADRVWDAVESDQVSALLLDLSVYEIVNVLTRRLGWPAPRVGDTVEDLLGAGLPLIRVDGALAAEAAAIATDTALSGDDASFLAAARQWGAVLVTGDRALRDAGGADAVGLDELT
jgi:predicted nucleic acid-binding protein